MVSLLRVRDDLPFLGVLSSPSTLSRPHRRKRPSFGRFVTDSTLFPLESEIRHEYGGEC